MSGVPFIRMYANDWFTGCVGLKADERGVYISMCVYIWTAGRRVPLDDAEAARMMCLQFNNYQRLRDALVRKGKVQTHDDGYGVKRAEKELDHARNRAEAGATARDGRRVNETAEGIHAEGEGRVDQVRPQAGEGAAPGRAVLGAKAGPPVSAQAGASAGEAQKIKQNQQAPNDLILKTKEREVREEKISVCHTPDAERATGQTDDPNFEKCKLAFNGSTNRIIDELKNSEGPYGTKARAAAWLADTLDDYGADAILDAFRFLERCRDEGQTIRDTRGFLTKNSARFVENKAAKKAVEAEKKSKLQPILNRMTGEIEWRKPFEPYVSGTA